MLGIGIDLVSLPEFQTQVETPGSHFLESILTARELRRVHARATAVGGSDDPAFVARHAGGRWAAKEAFIKAWSEALYGVAPVIERDEVNWKMAEVVDDRWGRPALQLHSHLAQSFYSSMDEIWGPLNDKLHLHLSISHDGSYAIAQVLIEAGGISR
nr:holo-ACP synthase [Schaalia vaccimaxillae]